MIGNFGLYSCLRATPTITRGSRYSRTPRSVALDSPARTRRARSPSSCAASRRRGGRVSDENDADQCERREYPNVPAASRRGVRMRGGPGDSVRPADVGAGVGAAETVGVAVGASIGPATKLPAARRRRRGARSGSKPLLAPRGPSLVRDRASTGRRRRRRRPSRARARVAADALAVDASVHAATVVQKVLVDLHARRDGARAHQLAHDGVLLGADRVVRPRREIAELAGVEPGGVCVGSVPVPIVGAPRRQTLGASTAYRSRGPVAPSTGSRLRSCSRRWAPTSVAKTRCSRRQAPSRPRRGHGGGVRGWHAAVGRPASANRSTRRSGGRPRSRSTAAQRTRASPAPRASRCAARRRGCTAGR